MKHLHLIISTILVVLVAFTYGVIPGKLLPMLFDFEVASTDMHNIFRAVMGLYIAMVIIWIAGITKPHLWKPATIVNIFFMSGLAAGRLISFAADGIPSLSLVIGFLVEVLLVVWGCYNLKKYSIK
jgi:Domain of unknown function (DUF4345)